MASYFGSMTCSCEKSVHALSVLFASQLALTQFSSYMFYDFH